MKKLITIFLLLASFAVNAQTKPNAIVTFENGRKQYVLKKDSLFYFIRGTKLIMVKKVIVKIEKI